MPELCGRSLNCVCPVAGALWQVSELRGLLLRLCGIPLRLCFWRLSRLRGIPLRLSRLCRDRRERKSAALPKMQM